MSAPGRFVLLYVGWDHEDWFLDLTPGARLAWIYLLCHVRSCGSGAEVKRLSPKVAARKWSLDVSDVEAMLAAATGNGALRSDGGVWSLTDPTPVTTPGRRAPRGWEQLRLEILARDSYKCRYCGGRASQVDHVVPVSRGGGEEDGNLVAACGPCNRSKGGRSLDEWRPQ